MTLRIPDDLDVARLNAAGRRSYLTDARRAEYHDLKGRGLCVRAASHGPAEPGKTLCAPCLADAAHRSADSYRARSSPRRRNFCARCTGEGHNARTCTGLPVPGWTDRNPRYERANAYKATLRAQGSCINNPKHAKPKANRSRCDACLAARRKAKS